MCCIEVVLRWVGLVLPLSDTLCHTLLRGSVIHHQQPHLYSLGHTDCATLLLNNIRQLRILSAILLCATILLIIYSCYLYSLCYAVPRSSIVVAATRYRCNRQVHVKLKVGDTECPLQVCQLSRSSESAHFRSFVEM